MAHVKICGVCTVEDARACVRLGASAIGLNFVVTSPRRVDRDRARAIAKAVRDASHDRSVQIVGVVAEPDDALVPGRLRALAEDVGLDCLQLHGDEGPTVVAALLPHAYKAVRIASPRDVATARTYPGEHLLVDAKVDGALGGTGKTFDWSLVRGLADERHLTVAGGLAPDNVRAAILATGAYCVDVASGVERSPGSKDLDKVRAFIDAARGA